MTKDRLDIAFERAMAAAKLLELGMGPLVRKKRRSSDLKKPFPIINDPLYRLLPDDWAKGDQQAALKVAKAQLMRKKPAERDDDFVLRIALAYISTIVEQM